LHVLLVFFEEEELRFGCRVDRVSQVVGALEGVLEDATRVALEGLTGRGIDDVADHSGRCAVLTVLPREDRERVGIGLEPHVRFLNAHESLDRGAVEVDPFGERLLGLPGGHGDVLDSPQNVGEL